MTKSVKNHKKIYMFSTDEITDVSTHTHLVKVQEIKSTQDVVISPKFQPTSKFCETEKWQRAEIW